MSASESQRSQRYLSELQAGLSIPFRHRPLTALLCVLFALTILLLPVLVFFISPHRPSFSPGLFYSQIPALIFCPIFAGYNFYQYITRPTIITLSKTGLEHLGAVIPWTEVTSVYAKGKGKGNALFIVLTNGLNTKVRFYGIRLQMNKIPLLLSAIEYPDALIESLKACVGDRYKGVVSDREARRLDRL